MLGMLTASFLSNAQSVTITQPNGGEVLYACQTYQIRWTQTGSPSNYWNIDYSLDGGTIWTSVASNFLVTNGQYNWTVPNVQSSTVKMRVMDANNSSTVDMSNNVFTINIPVVLTSPNGGENWVGGTVQNITWNLQGTSNTFNLAYSTNNGSSWNNIATNLSNSTGIYAWTVPAMATNTNVLVRVMDAVTNCMQDVSNSTFTITAPTPALTYPNGGETFVIGCSIPITWNQNTFYENVRIDISNNNGSSWTTVTSSASNTGSYLTGVPITEGSQYRFRVSNASNANIFDASDASFSVTSPILYSNFPSGTYTSCYTATITANAMQCLDRLTLTYSIDGGTTWSTIVSSTYNGYNPTFTYNWTLPAFASATNVLVKISDYYSSGISRTSSSFTVQPNTDVTVTSPNGGEIIPAYTTVPITWTNTAGASGIYIVQVTTDGSSYTTLASNLVGNTYNWTAPNAPGVNYKVRVIDQNNNCKIDASNSSFTIVAATPQLTSPNGGETFNIGCSIAVTWNTSLFFEQVRIDLSLDGGTTWSNIATNASNNGSYVLGTPSTLTTQGKIRISNTSQPNIFDVTEGTFSIVRPQLLTNFNSGGSYTACNSYNITATGMTCFDRITIYYSTDGGTTYNTIVNSTYNGYQNNFSYAWTIPGLNTTTNALIKIQDYYSSGQFVVSAVPFTILGNTDITVTSPNGGESYVALNQLTVTWSNTANVSGIYTLQYASDGSSYSTVASNLTGNAYVWNIPNSPGSAHRFRVIDSNNNCKTDASNAGFIITPATPVLLTPNGGEMYTSPCAIPVTWNTQSIYGNVRIDYSGDGGSTWTNVVTNTSNTGSYSMGIPQPFTTNGLVKISNADNVNLSDVSAAPFSTQAAIVMTSPTSSSVLTSCNTFTISATRMSCMDRISLAYSLDNGTTWNTIISSTYNGYQENFSYTWNVPAGLSSAQARIRISDYYSSAFSRVSDAFVINPNTDIVVTSPNGGESFEVGSTMPITWTNTANTSGIFTIQVSSSGVGSFSTIASNITGNSYNYTVPNSPSSNYLVQVIDQNNTCKTDRSNAVFSVVPQQPKVLSPNGGETFLSTCVVPITWNTSTYAGNVRIDVSFNGGTSWTNITTSASNTGSFTFGGPYTISSDVKVRVSSATDLTYFDVSDASFTIQQGMRMTSFTSPTTLTGCYQTTITADRMQCTDRLSIYYSTDNGATWSTIVSSTYNGYNPTFSYTWTVPNGLSTTQGLVKIQDYYSSAINTISSIPFTIQPNTDITVTAPATGTIVPAGTTTNLTWTSNANTSGIFGIQISTNGGGSYSTVVTNITGNSYTWTAPNVPSTTYRFVVYDFNATCKAGYGSNFTVTPATPVLTAPNGGEVYYFGCGITTTWNTASFYENVRIDVSYDGGTTWSNVVTNTSNNGTYTFSVPNITTTQGLVRVSSANNLALNDVSNAPFSLMQSIDLTNPTQGQVLTSCNTYVISATNMSCLDRISLFYSTDNGTIWNTIVSSTYNGYNNNFNYNWTVPSGLNSTQAKIKIQDYYSSQFFDILPYNFTLSPNADITVTAPNGGESLNALTTTTISWTNTSNSSGVFHVGYYIGTTYYALANNITGNNYIWNVPNIPSSAVKIQVIDAQNTCKYDESNSTFSIIPAQPALTAPNGGEVYYATSLVPITWNSSTFYGNVRLDFSSDGGTTWSNITTSASNNGSYSWWSPNIVSTQCLIRISNSDNIALFDISNNPFTIKAAVTVLTPNGDNGVTVWGGCTVTSITFDHTLSYTSYKIEYTLNNGATWTTLTNNFTANDNPSTYTWNMPNSPSSQVKVRVSAASASSIFDVSDNTFTITKPVTIIQPNFGGIMTVGSSFNIQWSSDGISNLYDLYYSVNGGSSYNTIAIGYNTSNNTYPWVVPSNVSNNCRILVRDNINSCKADTSDVPFIISNNSAAITILSPNGINDTIVGCSTRTITWAEASILGTYDISYSLNSGATWTDIVTNYSTITHSYNWNVPNNINSNSVLLRVRSSSNPGTLDLTDAFISLRSGELEVAESNITACVGIPVQLSASGGTNYTWSPSTGMSNPNIANPTLTPTSTQTYFVTSDNNGCIMSSFVNVNVTNSTVPASVSIESNQGTSICIGSTVTFTATAINGGQNATYIWRKNGSPVSTSGPTYTTSSIANNDVITCTMTSSLNCVTGSPATSNAITLSASTSFTPSISISSNPSTSICPGTLVTFSTTQVNAGGNPTYSWLVNGIATGITSSSYASTSLSNGDIVTAVVYSNSSCAISPSATSNAIVIAMGTALNTPSAISGSASLCEGNTTLYSVPSVAGSTSYQWALPQGWSGTSTTNSISITAGSSSGTISVMAMNACGTSAAASKDVVVNALPAIPTSISGSGAYCPGNIIAFSTSTVQGATSYTWTLPSGWSGSSTSTIVDATLGSQSGSVTVKANNSCGSSPVQSLFVTLQSPATPGAIMGSTSLCAGGTSNYSITEIANATSYTWVLPSDWSGVSTSNSISVSVGNSSGNIAVVANNACGASAPQSLSVSVLTSPQAPSAISGSTNLCASATANYTVQNIAGVTSYEWAWPEGWSANANNNQLATVAGNNGGSVSVRSLNDCGTSEYTSIAVNVGNAPSSPASISGNQTPCASEAVSYSVPSVQGATSYTWTLPNGWSGTSTSNSLATTAGSGSGNISVTANNACGSSAPQNLTVQTSPLPSAPTAIAGSTYLCAGSTDTYSVAPVSGASSYTWIVPAGWNGASTSESIALTANGTGGSISVVANNACGASPAALLNVAVSSSTPVISSINTAATYCVGTPATFTAVSASPIDTYQWTLPQSWSGNSSSAILQAITVPGTFNVSVVGTNNCGTSAPQSVAVTVFALPTISATVQPSATVCAGTSVTLQGLGGNSYTWNNGALNNVDFVPNATSTYTVVGTDANGCTNSTQVDVVVYANPTVSVSYDAFGTLCTSANNMELYGGIPAGGNYFGNFVTDNHFNAQLAGSGQHSISYTYTDANGCSATASDVVNVIVCVGVEEVEKGSIKLYPNPTKDMLTVEFDHINEPVQVMLMNTVGEVVSSYVMYSNKSSFDVNALAPGVYVVKCNTNLWNKSIPFIKE
jgi:hypothetical protein